MIGFGYGNTMFLATHGILARGGTPPANTVAPAITGTAQEGQTLTCSTGTWTGDAPITYAYQWKRNNVNIGSATNSTYLLVTADVGQNIKCTITATNGAGSASADSNTVVPIAAFTGLLDTYSGASAAYSLRRLSSTYTGNLIRVRRSSDNAEQNIGYNSSNVLDTASLLTFCGAGNGFVTTWYDQSGNANNATQTTAANQPQIVSSGAMITTNGKNSISFDGSNDHFILGSTINVASSHFQSIVAKRNASSQSLYGLSGDTGTNYICAHSSDNFYYFQGRNIFTQKSNSTDTTANQILLTGLNNAGTMAIYKNSVVIPSTQISDSRTMTINTIAKYFFGFYVTGNLQEIVYYNSNQSTNRTGIETNINSFYSVY